MSGLEELRKKAAALAVASGEVREEDRAEYRELVHTFLAHGGAPSDRVVAIGKAVFGVDAAEVDGAEKDETAAVPAKNERDSLPKIEIKYMEEFMFDVLVDHGVPEDEARVAADVLIAADKRGIDSHGIGRLKPIYCDRIAAGILKPTAPFSVVKDTPTTALVDGNCGLGLVIGPKCMQMAIDKAKQHGLGMVVARNSTHYGMAGYYALMADAAGCIGITGTNARPSIAPTFGVDPMLGTNPITWGIPSSDPFPYVLDCATSICQRGKIEQYAREGKPTPRGQVVDRQGRERTDTDQILIDLVTGECALAPLGGVGTELGGYKGYGYATVVEILSSALQSGTTSPDLIGVDRATGKKIPMPLGHWFIAIDVERFLPLAEFKANVGSLLTRLRDSAKDPTGPGRIYTAGEIEYDIGERRKVEGGIPLPRALQKDMLDLRAKSPALQSKYASYPFEK